MSWLKTLQDLSNDELLELARLLADHPEHNNVMFLVNFASELRQRKLYATEDFIIQLAGRLRNA